MNCDQVFNILTRGPFPTGDPIDVHVESHLETCSNCWQLAEALRPALDVFQEAVPPAESRDLPGYWGDARPAAQIVAELAASATPTLAAPPLRRVARSQYRPNLQRSHPPAWPGVVRLAGFIAAVALTAVGVALLMQAG